MLGTLFVDNVWLCYTKEPALRGDHLYIAGESCLPPGWYNVSLTPSRRYEMLLPLLAGSKLQMHGGLLVALGMRILPGQDAWGSESGILVGQTQGPNAIHHTRAAFKELFVMLAAAKNRMEAIDLRIINP